MSAAARASFSSFPVIWICLAGLHVAGFWSCRSMVYSRSWLGRLLDAVARDVLRNKQLADQAALQSPQLCGQRGLECEHPAALKNVSDLRADGRCRRGSRQGKAAQVALVSLPASADLLQLPPLVLTSTSWRTLAFFWHTPALPAGQPRPHRPALAVSLVFPA